jgi:cell division protein ZapA
VGEKGRAVVEIYGGEYIVRGDSPPEYLSMLANYIDRKMKQVAQRQPQLSATKIAVLTALNIADELSKLQEDYDNLVKLLDSEKKKDFDGKKEFEPKRA